MAARDDKPDLNRTETDKSLHQERTKTDGHLERRQREFEQRTTDSIEEDRRIVDERRILDRASRDRVTEEHEQAITGDESLMMVERELSDQATYQARELEDSNLRRERRGKQLLVEAVLYAERLRTNDRLSQERKGVDHASECATRLLADEQARYTNIKEELSDRELAMATICHDLQNQCVATSMGVQLLRKQLSRDARDRAEITRQLSALEENTAFMSRMIKSMLDIERFSRGKVTLNLAPVDLCLLLQDTGKFFPRSRSTSPAPCSPILAPSPCGYQGIMTACSKCWRIKSGTPLSSRPREAPFHSLQRKTTRG